MPLITGHFLKMHFHAVGPTQNSKHSQKLSHNCLQYIIIAFLEALSLLLGNIWLLGCPPNQRPVIITYLVVVQLLSCVQLFVTPWTAAGQASLSFIISWSLFKLMSIESVISATPFSSFSRFFPSSESFPVQSQLFASGGQNIRALISASVLQMSIKWGLIFFRIDWFDLLVVQGTLKSLLQPQFKSINSLAQFLQLYMTI